MTHPLIPRILELAAPVAQELGLDVVGAAFHTHQSPPVLRVDVCNADGTTGLDDCERMSRNLDAVLDVSDVLPDAYVLEISTPGLSKLLSSDREFASFRGFGVIATLTEPYKGKKQWTGRLIERTEKAVRISQKGRVLALPRTAIAQVCLDDHPEPD